MPPMDEIFGSTTGWEGVNTFDAELEITGITIVKESSIVRRTTSKTMALTWLTERKGMVWV
jgi:hypothetical protein